VARKAERAAKAQRKRLRSQKRAIRQTIRRKTRTNRGCDVAATRSLGAAGLSFMGGRL
jgi:hypothetical protein